jgi:hypothetical protein
MTIRVRPSVVLMAAGLALSGCIDIECPAEFARPASRERYCGHTGDVGAPVTYRTYANPNLSGRPVPMTTTTTTTTVVVPPPPPMIQAAPPQGVSVEPMPPPGAPTQIR